MTIAVTELANDSKRVQDRVIDGGEIVDVERDGHTVAEIRPKVGASRAEVLRLLRGRGFSETDSRELHSAIDAAAEVIGYAGGD